MYFGSLPTSIPSQTWTSKFSLKFIQHELRHGRLKIQIRWQWRSPQLGESLRKIIRSGQSPWPISYILIWRFAYLVFPDESILQKRVEILSIRTSPRSVLPSDWSG